jgi:hypothetical protein
VTVREVVDDGGTSYGEEEAAGTQGRARKILEVTES